MNTRILYIDNVNAAKEEIRKIGVDAEAIPNLAHKAVFITMKIENVPSNAANIIKQEMLGKGGDAAVSRGTAGCTAQYTDVLIMGTYGQICRLIRNLSIYPGNLKEIADEIQKELGNLEIGKPEKLEFGKYSMPVGEKTYIMGILNVTPDSFSDGGQFSDIEAAIRRAKEMIDDGADIIDIGGESTRPGFESVDAIEEINRVVPVIKGLAEEINVPVSIDTSKALVAEKALEAGASIVNDIWGLQGDSAMAQVVSKYGAGIVMMHNQNEKEYADIMGDIIKFLSKSIKIAQDAGIRRENMIIDPGIGFAKTLQHNLDVMGRLKELDTLGVPVLLGTSRKSMIGNVLNLPVNERLEGTAATVTLGVASGVDIIRVHDVKEMTRVARMTDAMVRRGYM